MKKLSLILLLLSASFARADNLVLPNFSFESPAVPPVDPYAGPDIDYWQKTPQPFWYDPSQFNDTPWTNFTGEFYNVPFPGVEIDNCDGYQAAFLFAIPEVGFFQDYNSVYGTNTIPSHAFNATFKPGRYYTLTLGAIGGGGNMKPGVTLLMALYYRDAGSNMIPIAMATITNDPATFPTATHLVDFQAQLPAVKATDAWAGQNIGVLIESTVTPDLIGGYWDLDNVRLTETATPALTTAHLDGGHLAFTVASQPGLQFAIESAINPGPDPANWTPVGVVTNTTGFISFTETNAAASQRFYRARQLP